MLDCPAYSTVVPSIYICSASTGLLVPLEANFCLTVSMYRYHGVKNRSGVQHAVYPTQNTICTVNVGVKEFCKNILHVYTSRVAIPLLIQASSLLNLRRRQQPLMVVSSKYFKE